MRIKALVRYLLPVLVLAAGAGGFLYLKSTRPEQPKSTPKEKVWQVRTLSAELRSQSPVITLYGAVTAPSELRAAAPGNAVVAEVEVREGQLVRAGQALVRLDSRDFEPQVEQARAEVADLQAQIRQQNLQHDNHQAALKEEQRLLELARAAVARAERLQRQQLGADSALDQAREALVRQELSLDSRQLAVDSHPLALAQLQARLQRARAALTQAERDLERSRLVAPFDGVISAVAVSAGDRVAPGTILLRLYSIEDLEIRARIPARFQSEIQAALAAGTSLSANARLADTQLSLRLERLAGDADASGVDGLFRLTQGAGPVRPGNLLRLELQRPEQHDVIAVPIKAIYGNSRLYLLDDGRLRGVEVEAVGQARSGEGDNLLLVRSPAIAAGAAIVVTHLPNAVEGLKVTDQP